MGRFYIHYRPVFIAAFTLAALFNLTCKDSVPASKNNESTLDEGDSQNFIQHNQPLPAANITMGILGGVSAGKGSHTHCGDGHLGRNEECDDGNRFDADGCDRHCRREIIFVLCHFQCDDPVCAASCQPLCEPASCQATCEPPVNPPNCTCEADCETPECEVHCPRDGCEEDSCPACEISCGPPSCTTNCDQINPQGPTCEAPEPDCEIQCSPPMCSWLCTEPECTNPHCEPVCDLPALVCEESALQPNTEINKPAEAKDPQAKACHPECSFECDDPTCSARCVPDHCGYNCDLQTDCQPRCELSCERPSCEAEEHE